ncbi:MAG: hypothetical protein WA173_18730 [Pseudomonas sp.]|uniref:hypothetical protein n=1 Tax=Pseudomonas sp. TaxID=306 RepID=UPI003BB62210
MTTHSGAVNVWHDDPQVWRFVFTRYLGSFTAMSLLWEVAQLPLYRLWAEESIASITYVVIHCTLGDMLIGVVALLAALVVTRARGLERWHWARIGTCAITLGFAYTMFSEWLNTSVRMSWAYSDRMPLTPFIPLGISPLLQWLVVPACALLWAKRLGGRRVNGD